MCLKSFGWARTSQGLNAITSPADRPGQEGCGSTLPGSLPRGAERGPLNPGVMHAMGRETPNNLPGVLQMLSAFSCLQAAPALTWRTRYAARCFPLTHGAPGPPPAPSPSAAPVARWQHGGGRGGGAHAAGPCSGRILAAREPWGAGAKVSGDLAEPAEGKGCLPRPGGMQGREATPSSRDTAGMGWGGSGAALHLPATHPERQRGHPAAGRAPPPRHGTHRASAAKSSS